MHMVEWYVYALITMLFFSFGNIALKSLMNEQMISSLQKNSNLLLSAFGVILLGVVVAYVLFISRMTLPENSIAIFAAFLVTAGIGFVALLAAVSFGKIAPVTAIVSTSSVMVAILSVVVLHDTLKLQEIAGISLAFVGIMLLVYS